MLGPQYRTDPLFFLRVKVAIFWAFPGSIVATVFMAYSAVHSDGNWGVLGPFIMAQCLITASAFLLFKHQYARIALSLLGLIATLMILGATFIAGGISSMTVPWLTIMPLVVALFVGHRAAIVTTIAAPITATIAASLTTSARIAAGRTIASSTAVS